MKASLIIPALNEESTIKEVIDRSRPFVDEIVVADDGSTDDTALIAIQSGAKVVRNPDKGLESNIANAIPYCQHELIITIDADMEHKPEDIELLKKKIDEGYDVAIGRRPKIPREGEINLSNLTKEHFGIEDPLCGLRAIRKEVLDKIPFAKHGYYGLDFLIKAIKQGFKAANVRISEMPIRQEPSVGSLERIEKQLEAIREHVAKNYIP